MGSRKIVFGNDQIYHIFNRGIDKRPTFTDKREYKHALLALKFYMYERKNLRFSHFLNLDLETQQQILKMSIDDNKIVSVLAYCFMPNHFHFILKQKKEGGISRFMANFTNSYTKYFNAKHKRQGPLFQGLFKAVWVEDDSQPIHLSRYIHLNPIASMLITLEELPDFPWSSYKEYLNSSSEVLVDKTQVLALFSSVESYKKFVNDHISYAQELEKIKHLALE